MKVLFDPAEVSSIVDAPDARSYNRARFKNVCIPALTGITESAIEKPARMLQPKSINVAVSPQDKKLVMQIVENRASNLQRRK